MLLASQPASAQGSASVEIFSPQGVVKGIRQVTARFSEQIVAFGDPRLVEPFDISCPEKGYPRWADGRNWVYDFDRDVPAGILCSFSIKPELRTLSGKPLSGSLTFSFSTGGPAIKESWPREGFRVDEDQVFVLVLDAEADENSVGSGAYCSIEGINERVGVKVLKGEVRDKIMGTRRMKDYRDLPVVVLQCRQKFPNKSDVTLIWGKGVRSSSGVPATEDQKLHFRTRDPFAAKFSCQRENARADCIPILPMRLGFTSPVSWDLARKIVLKGPETTYKASKPSRDMFGDGEGETEAEVVPEDENFVDDIFFKGPFPEHASLSVVLPKGLKDDAGRSLANADIFPLTVKTDEYPPLAKFAARFGIIEAKGDAALPVTLRNLEREVRTRMLRVDEKKTGTIEAAKEKLLDKAIKLGEAVNPVLPEPAKGKSKEYVEGLKGRLHKIRMDKEEKIISWLRIVASAERNTSVIKGEGDTKEFAVPKPEGAKAFEVVGIPLKKTGIYVVEMESQILGASLLGEQSPLYVPTVALVTNLSAHFKWGRESSLVWVTTLDKAEPVKGAAVSIRDCNGKLLWKGSTDDSGVARIKTAIPFSWEEVPRCSGSVNYSESYRALDGVNTGLFVFAKTQDDLTFVHTSWDKGIEPWRYNLERESRSGPVLAHTVLDRSLVRAGETVHMKHIVRKHSMAGFSAAGNTELPKTAVIYHMGGEQRYQFRLKWDGKGIAETTWKIPEEAKLGNYIVVLSNKTPEEIKHRPSVGGYERGDEDYFYPDGLKSGSLRVEEFRVPLMKGIVQPPKERLVNATEIALDLHVSYLSGGSAGIMPVKLRTQVQPRFIRFDDYEDFTFANGDIKVGISRRADSEADAAAQAKKSEQRVRSTEQLLDKAGSARVRIDGLPKISTPQDVVAELEFRDPNGEVQTVSTKIPLYPSKILLGIKPDSWASSKEAFKFYVAAVDPDGRPAPNVTVKVELLQRKFLSHRKRLVGGFYAYEHVTEIKDKGKFCTGTTDARGLLICESKSPVSGNVILQAVAEDDMGNRTAANRDVWIAGKGEWWFDVSDSDRIDLLPEKKRYEPGDTAKFQVRMPFREATALVSIEREGVIDTSVKKLSGKNPVIEIPVKNNYAPNIFVSVLCVRGRAEGVKPAALVDLGKPAYKLGIAEINVGWRAHEFKVKVSADKGVYKVREKVVAKINVRRADGKLPPKGSEVAIAAVDEGLLELMPNRSWKLLEAMMGKRGYEVKTSTAQAQVVGKRHYGLKALPQGGGGGRQVTRELFDTLLYWKARVPLNEKGEAAVEIPLNDSLTSFRIVAVASSLSVFGMGETTVRTTQDLMLLSGLPQVVREGDEFRAGFTVRNSSQRRMEVEITATIDGNKEKPLDIVTESLSPGEAKEIGWQVNVPYGAEYLTYEAVATEKGGVAKDSLKVKQKIAEAVPVRTFQATISQLEKPLKFTVEKPGDSVPGKGGINISLRPRLSNGLGGVTWYMKQYPYRCMEQKISRAIALKDDALWKQVLSELPSHLDSDGLLKYFPTMPYGSEILTSYLIAVADEAGREIPKDYKGRMEGGLKKFVEGRIMRGTLPLMADLSIRKLTAVEALSRGGNAEPKLLDSIEAEPNLWPTSAVIDWLNILVRLKDVKERERKLKETEQILRARLNFHGTTMGFSTEKTDCLWWLMVSCDLNAVKTVLAFMDFDAWKEDMPRLVRGAMGRQSKGMWSTTLANAWGVLAMEKFSKKFEAEQVSGMTSAELDDVKKALVWKESPGGKSIMFPWPKGKEDVALSHQGKGKPWVSFQSLAAIPLKEALLSGYKIKKTLVPIEQKHEGKWSRGDVVRVRLEVEAQADMTWVVVSDPVPAGSSILGTGLGRDSKILTRNEERKGWVWPSFEERSFEAFKAYYEYVPKGVRTVEYTLRLNNEGVFHLPPTRAEALYAPEMFGEIPNGRMVIGQ
jgi:hypothetical protein